MGRQYRHLTLAEREDIMVHWKNRVGVSEIARLVGRDKSTVSREIRPNGWYSPVAGRMWCYRASTAHDKSQRRARRCRRQPLLADPRRLELVARLIRERATRWCLVGGKAPSKRAADVSLVIEQALAPHTAAPSPWTGATSSPPGPPSKNHWAPPSTSARPAAPGSAAQARTPTACCASTSPRGPHWTASTPRGSNRCTINSTNDHANASAGKPLRKPTHTARCTSCEKPRPILPKPRRILDQLSAAPPFPLATQTHFGPPRPDSVASAPDPRPPRSHRPNAAGLMAPDPEP